MRNLIAGLVLTCASQSAVGAHYVILASFSSEVAAQEQLKQHQSQFENSNILKTNQGLHRIAVGPYASSQEAEDVQRQATDSGIKHAWTLAAADQNAPIQTSAPASRNKQPRKVSMLNEVKIDRFEHEVPVLNEEIAALLASKTNRTLSTFELLQTKEEINKLLALNGYVNSGVVIPDQKIDDGTLRFEFVQGELTGMDINSNFRNRYIASRLDVTSPFNLFALQQSLKALEQDPQINKLDARVSPGAKPGDADLNLDVTTQKTFEVLLEAANDRSPSVGSENGNLLLSARNLTGWGETLQAGTSVTQGLDAQNARIHVPLTSRGTSVELKYQISDSSVIEEPFDDIDVDSETESISLLFSLPIIRSLTTKLDAHLTFEVRRNETTLLGQPFSFSEGAINGESKVAPVRLAVSYLSQQPDNSLAARFSVSRGTSNFDASDALGQANGEFTSYLAQVQYSKLLSDRTHFTLRALAQYASDPLLSVEKFALGGIGSVRGYRQNQVVRDNTYLASAEWHHRFDLPIQLSFVLFTDWGSGENHDDAALQGKQDLSSVGVGFALANWHGIYANLYLAHGFDDFDRTEHDLQDDGIHFRLGYSYEF